MYWIIDFMLKDKSLLEDTKLFSPREYQRNDKIILKYFQWNLNRSKGTLCRGDCDILMQLQVLLPVVGDGYRIFLLSAFIIGFLFGKQL